VRGVYGGHFQQLILDDNFRQGVSVDDGSDLLFEDCVMLNTGQGAAASPACGVDIEPGANYSKLTVCCSHSFSQSNSVPCVWMIRSSCESAAQHHFSSVCRREQHGVWFLYLAA
jgi:hypothetical protein